MNAEYIYERCRREIAASSTFRMLKTSARYAYLFLKQLKDNKTPKVEAYRKGLIAEYRARLFELTKSFRKKLR